MGMKGGTFIRRLNLSGRDQKRPHRPSRQVWCRLGAVFFWTRPLVRKRAFNHGDWSSGSPDEELLLGMRLIVVHHHLRPGGVRRVMEQSLPWISRDRISEVILAAGEAPDAEWFKALAARMPDVRVTWEVDAAFGYMAEIGLKSRAVRIRVARMLERLLSEPGARSSLVWVHNPGLARNLPMSAAIARVCENRGVRVVWHHHDWWFDNRWSRWSEIRASGFRTLREATRATVPAVPVGAHVGINRPDVARLRAGFRDNGGGWPAARPG